MSQAQIARAEILFALNFYIALSFVIIEAASPSPSCFPISLLLIIRRQSVLKPPPKIRPVTLQLRYLSKAVIEMASEQPSIVTVFRALTFGPLIAVSVIILLASLLKILDVLSSLSSRIAEDRAGRRIEIEVAQGMEDGLIRNRVVENGTIDQPPVRLQMANRQDQGNGEGAGSTTEEPPVSVNALIDERVWWTIYQ